jgi:predicted nucleotidyltransferase component of viral defense system
MNQHYKKQVELLLSALPEVAKEACFALYGGTAINLFLRNMPRLSVDIDLLYLPIEDRPTSLKKIAEALERIKNSIQTVVTNAKIRHNEDKGKLFITTDQAEIKVEVNTTGRGTLVPPVKMALCDKAQKDFDAFAVIQVVDKGQLFGGKICAALDRQHPRDLFDIKYLLENEDFTEDIKTGFLYSLIGSERSYKEILYPNMLDQRQPMRTKFDGMSSEPFTYEDFEATREKLLQVIHASLTDKDRAFVLGVKNLTPDWSIYDFKRFPAVQWKLKHLQTLKDNDPEKHRKLYAELEKNLATS